MFPKTLRRRGRSRDQHSGMNQIWILDIEVLDRCIKLAVEKDDKLRLEELARQAEVAQLFCALDLLELHVVRTKNREDPFPKSVD